MLFDEISVSFKVATKQVNYINMETDCRKSVAIIFSLLSIVVTFIVCDNSTNNYRLYMNEKSFQTKQHRLLSFNSDSGDIDVELSFNAPFIRIPIKKSMDSINNALINVNVSALILTGVIAFGVSFLIPAIISLMSKQYYCNTNNGEVSNGDGYRSIDHYGRDFWTILQKFDQNLNEHRIDATLCLHRMICWTVKNSSKNVRNGHSSSMDKIIDGLATNKWLLDLIGGTGIYSAVQNGLNQQHCSREYHQCRITQKSLQTLMRNFFNDK